MQVYIAKAPSADSSFNGQGTVWTKIYSSGLINPTTQQWATDIVNANNGEEQVPFSFALSEPDISSLCRKASTLWLFPLHYLLASTSFVGGKYLYLPQMLTRDSQTGAEIVSCFSYNSK